MNQKVILFIILLFLIFLSGCITSNCLPIHPSGIYYGINGICYIYSDDKLFSLWDCNLLNKIKLNETNFVKLDTWSNDNSIRDICYLKEGIP